MTCLIHLALLRRNIYLLVDILVHQRYVEAMNLQQQQQQQWESFADMRKISTVDELCLFLFKASDRLYENGRLNALALNPRLEVPQSPSWRFNHLSLKSHFNEDSSCGLTLHFSIFGNDPYNILHSMFDHTGIRLLYFRAGWHDFTAFTKLDSSAWSSLFVRRKLENDS